MFKAKYQAHRLVNYIFYIIVFIFGFFVGIGAKKIDIKNLFNEFLMIDNVEAFELVNVGDLTINEEYLIQTIKSSHINFDFYKSNNIVCKNTIYSNYSYGELDCLFLSDEIANNLYFSSFNFNNHFYNINNLNDIFNFDDFNFEFVARYDKNNGDLISSSVNISGSLSSFSGNFNQNGISDTFSNFDLPLNGNISKSNLDDFNNTINVLNFDDFLLDAQVNVSNGSGYDFYINQVGILDMREDTYIVSSHTCPNDGDFTNSGIGSYKDVCNWEYKNEFSDFLVFYLNGRIYNSEDLPVSWEDITFYKNHTYSLSFTFYGITSSEELYSVLFSHEGYLNQEILYSDFDKILVDYLSDKTYITFAFTPTEDITFDHFFLKFSANGNYLDTIGMSRLWVYKDITGLSLDNLEIIETDNLLYTNENLRMLVDDPFINSPYNSFFDYKYKNFGLTEIVTIPINVIRNISNGTCKPYNIYLLNKTITLPCGNTIFWDRPDVKNFKNFWNLFFGGIICYGIGCLIYKDVKNAHNPLSDKVEVIDL